MDVVLIDRTADLATVPYPLASVDDLRRTADEIRAIGRTCLAISADVRDSTAIGDAVASGIQVLGGIDVVVSAAGVISYGSTWDLTELAWSTVVGVNLTGPWLMARAIAPHWIKRQGGCFVAIASVAAVEGGEGYAHYAASKHGLIGLVRAMALELGAHGVRVNAILPGPVDTVINDNPVARDRIAGRSGATRADYLQASRNWHLLRRDPLAPSAIASAVAWLISDEALDVTGALIRVDAGHLVMPGRHWSPS
jgi:NAD(P)-dependent dehydrogenase (short-subunit alcohol dehydrogenase family)